MSKHPTHVYIVDDDRSFGRSLKRLLSARGIAADCFESARAFLDSVPSGLMGVLEHLYNCGITVISMECMSRQTKPKKKTKTEGENE